MDADSSYGGSDTAQDSHSSLDNSHSSHNISKHEHNNEDTVTTAVHVIPDTTENNQQTPVNHYYHKNEITVPVNLDDTDFQKNTDSKLHYMATANLNINETLEHHNNLDEMSKNYKSQHKLQESFSKKSKHSTSSGIDNPAFIEDVKSTFNNDMPYSNGLTPDPSKTNNHEPVTEAVNLELINMKPGGAHHNGLKGYESSGMTTIPLKKDDEDMRSPYDEYFVPVNEHRKYMRGEKLYVTKDNRVEKRKGKCICWTICIALAAIAVIIGILAAAGLLASQPPMPQAVEASGRSFDNDNIPINKGGISLPTKGQNHPITPEPPITTVSSIIPSTDQSQILVPRVIESEFKIDNLEYNTPLLDKDSLEYKALSEAIERQIKESLLSNKELRNGTMNFDIKVMEMLPGSVLAKYRITWKPKDEYTYNYLENTVADPINEVSLNKILIEYLQRHRDLMGEFHIQESSIKSQRVLDLCKIQNNGCEHFCVFDYTRLNFACLCPEGQHLSTDQKRCKIPEPETTTKPPREILKHTKKATTEPFTTPETITDPASKSEPVPEDSQEEHHKNKVALDGASGFVLGTSSTRQTTTELSSTVKDHSMDFVFLPQDVSSSMGDFREITTTSPTSVLSALPVEFPTEKSPDEIQTGSNENKDRERFYFNPILSGPPTEKPTETTQKPFTEHVNNQHDFSYIPNLTVFPETENKNNTETEHELEIVHTENPTTSEYSLGNVYTPPAEVHFDITTKKSSMYMIHILKPLTYKEKYREPKIQELHTNPINSSETENNGTDHYIEDMDRPEQIHDEYNMSPFLPELDNDTFFNSLHSEEHFLEHEHHDNASTIKPLSAENPTTSTTTTPVTETVLLTNLQNNLAQMSPTILEVTTTKAPSLEFDELNTTNPFDNNTSDATNLNRNEQFITKDLEIEPLKPEVMIIISDKNDMTTEEHVTIAEENDIDSGTTAEVVTTTDYPQIPVEEEIIIKKYIPQLFENKTTENVENAHDDNTTEENYNNVQEYPSTFNESNAMNEETTTTENNDITENLTTTENNETINKNNTIVENVNSIYEEIINTTTEESAVLSFTYAIDTTEANTFNVLDEGNTSNSDILASTENTTNLLDEIITTEKTIINNNENNERISVPPVTMPVETTTTIMEFTTDLTETSTELTQQQTTTIQSENINNTEESETVSSIENSRNTTNIKNFNDITSSTEDLIALETTTNTEGSTIPVVMVNENEVKTESIENKTTDTTTEVADPVVTTIVVNTKQYNENEEDNTISTQSNQITSTVPDKEYQVKETVSDITTTEKLFVTHKTTTTLKMEEDSTENLSIIPLDGDRSYENKQNKDVLFESNDISDEKRENLNEILVANKNEEKPITEDFVLPKASRCSPGQFQCLNGTSVKDGNYCIQIEDRCDSVLDCSDGSDEINCMEEGCPNNFQCASKQCLKRHLVCDGILNCNDGSDEVNCESWSCNSNEMSCGISNRCIPASWKCDGRKHCPDGLDEEGCLHNGPCPAQSFRCTEESSCMPNSWKCDGQADCPGGEDESSCFCTEEEFKCITGGGCIAKSDRCDGIAQCLDKSDEWDCLKLDKLILNLTDTNDKEILQLQIENNTWYPICMDWTTWNTTFADLVCQKLGYSASSALESVPKPKNLTSEISYVLLTDQQKTLNFVENNVRNCDQYVSISCQEYVCGSPTALDLPSARIVGGDKAAPTQWPSLALLFNKKHNIYCTSTIVTPLWAVTSYSCIAGRTSQPINEEDWFLYAGGTNKGDNVTSQVRKLKEIVTHPQTKFSNFGFKNDAVLLKMRKPIHVNLNVSAVCLPNNGIEPRQLCVVAGWGINKPGEPIIQQYLHYLPVPLIDTEECNSTKHYNGKITSDKICAGYTDSDKTPCFNDEGAPLMCFSDKTATWELHGLLSHHGNCGSTNKHPAIYTAINPTLRTWMSHIIGSQALAVS